MTAAPIFVKIGVIISNKGLIEMINNATDKSKVLSEILRHTPEKYGLSVSTEGWLSISALIEKIDFISHSDLLYIVENSSKKRFSISSCGLFVRANQGHSLEHVCLNLTRVYPERPLYHGTTPLLTETILLEGLKPMGRQYVHLTDNITTALSVGKRYSKKLTPLD